MKNIENARDYLKIHSEFNLGDLVTESQHPLTVGLAELAKKDLGKSFETFKQVDAEALSIFENPASELLNWYQVASDHLAQGGRIFLGGCGATGRLSLGLEFLWTRLAQTLGTKYRPEQVISLMAGGDVALIASIEKFEDFPEYGARQLEELGFGADDLFVGITEGGETPWVIGATLWASEKSSHKPFFFYCNPDHILKDLTERTHRVLTDERIQKVNLSCGPMALSGSTRLQASTILMLGVGMGMFTTSAGQRTQWWQQFEQSFKALDYKQMTTLCESEAELYLQGHFTIYQTHPDFGLTVLTDTTERSPTFSLSSFENMNDQKMTPSWTYLSMPKSRGESAWTTLLGRSPRTLEWSETKERTGQARLFGFPVGVDAQDFRAHNIDQMKGRKLEVISIDRNEKAQVVLQLGPTKTVLNLGADLFTQAMLLKMLLNAHSTLMMGKLGRFESNVMTYVRPSNNKLIDRMARYTMALLKERQINVTFREVIELYYQVRSSLAPAADGAERPVVIELVNRLIAKKQAVGPIKSI